MSSLMTPSAVQYEKQPLLTQKQDSTIRQLIQQQQSTFNDGISIKDACNDDEDADSFISSSSNSNNNDTNSRKSIEFGHQLKKSQKRCWSSPSSSLSRNLITTTIKLTNPTFDIQQEQQQQQQVQHYQQQQQQQQFRHHLLLVN